MRSSIHRFRFAAPSRRWLAFLLSLSALAAATPCRAAEVAVNATAVGFLRRVPGFTYKHFAQEGYLTGSQGNGILHTDNNSYFIFDVSNVSGTITAATLQLYTSDERADVPEGGYWSSSASEQLVLHEVAANPATLRDYSTTQFNVGTPQYGELNAMFNDLADGPTFGSAVITEAAAEVQPGSVPGQPGGNIWNIPLSAAGISSLNSAATLWALGGTLADTTPPISTTTELLFGGSVPFSAIPGRATPMPRLVLTTSPGLSADFNCDHDVDGRDFLIWQRGLGLGSQLSNANGDASGNGQVGPEDLTLWRGQFGTSSIISASQPIPEPSAMLLTALCAVAATPRRQRKANCWAPGKR